MQLAVKRQVPAETILLWSQAARGPPSAPQTPCAQPLLTLSLPPGPLRLCISVSLHLCVSAQQVWPSVLALSLPCRDTGPNRARTLLEVCPRPGALLAVGTVTDTLACCSMKGTDAVTGDTGDGQRSPRKHWD